LSRLAGASTLGTPKLDLTARKRFLPTAVNNHNLNISLSLNAARHAARLTSLIEGIWLQVQCSQCWASMAHGAGKPGGLGKLGMSSEESEYAQLRERTEC